MRKISIFIQKIKAEIISYRNLKGDKDKKQLITSIGFQLSNSSITASNNNIASQNKDVNTIMLNIQELWLPI